MTVTGYQAPGSSVLHRPLDLAIGSATIARTYCGLDLPQDDSWDTEATAVSYSCQQCATAYDTEQHRRAPWKEGERRVYSGKRRPGLRMFLREAVDGELQGYAWRLVNTPRPIFFLAKDARAPKDRPWRLTRGYDRSYGIGYFPTTTEAVDFTKEVEAAGRLVDLLKQADTDAWDEHTSALTFLERATPKETNPA